MSLKAKLTLDSSSYNKGMDEAKNKAGTTGKEIKQKLQDAGKGFESVNKMGGKIGGTFKNVVEAFKGCLSPIGLITAGITALGAVAVKVWDKMTMSAQEYAAKCQYEAQEATKAFEKLSKRQGEDNGYIDRLREISNSEEISNAMKVEASKLVQILNERYHGLGLSIQDVIEKTGKLDLAQQQVAKRQLKRTMTAKKLQVETSRVQADQTISQVIDGKGVYSSMVSSDLNDTPEGSSNSAGTSRTHKWGGYDVTNPGGTKDLATSWRSSDQVKELATALESKKQTLSDLKKQAESTTDNGQKKKIEQQTKALEKQIEREEQILKLQLKIEVARSMVSGTAKDSDKSKKWQDVVLKLEEYKLKLEQLSDIESEGTVNLKEKTEQLRKQTQLYSQQTKDQAEAKANEKNAGSKVQELLKKQQKYEYDNSSDVEKQGILRSKIQGVQIQKHSSQRKQQGFVEQLKKIKAEEAPLQEKNKKGTLSPEEQQRYIELGAKRAELEKKISAEGVIQATLANEAFDYQTQLNELIKKQKAYYDDAKRSLEQQVQIDNLLLQGKDKEAERQKIINDLKRKGITVDNAQVDEIMKKKEELNKVQSSRYYQDSNKSLDEQIQLQQLQLAGKYEEIQRQKIINDLKAKGLKYDKAEVDAIMAKKKQLGALTLKQDMMNKGNALKQQINSFKDPKQAEIDKRLEEARKTKGSDLTTNEKDTITKQVQLEIKAKDAMDMKPDFSKFQTFTNELASRGGFASSVVSADKNDVNKDILSVQKAQQRILNDVLTEMKKMGVIS